MLGHEPTSANSILQLPHEPTSTYVSNNKRSPHNSKTNDHYFYVLSTTLSNTLGAADTDTNSILDPKSGCANCLTQYLLQLLHFSCTDFDLQALDSIAATPPTTTTTDASTNQVEAPTQEAKDGATVVCS
jgi:hypothetical protein